MKSHVVKIDLSVLEGMEKILSQSAGYPTSMVDEIDYFQSESPSGWLVARDLDGDNVGFIRFFQQGSDWSLAELYVNTNLPGRKELARELLIRFLSENTFPSGHRLRFDFNYSDADLNSLVEELGCSDKKQTFHYLEMVVPESNGNTVEDSVAENLPGEIAEVLSHLHPVSEADAKSWLDNESLRIMYADKAAASVAQVYFYPESAEIHRIATHAKYLRQGFAKKLLTKICDELHTKKIKKLFLKVEDVRLPALGFYKDFGFKENVSKRQTWHSKYF